MKIILNDLDPADEWFMVGSIIIAVVATILVVVCMS